MVPASVAQVKIVMEAVVVVPMVVSVVLVVDFHPIFAVQVANNTEHRNSFHC